MPKPKPPCVTLYPWLHANLGPRSTALMTGTDVRALNAAVQLIELFSVSGSPEVLEAFGLTVRQMQPECWRLAYHAIAHVMDWSHRPELWLRAGLSLFNPGRCKFEP